MRDDALQPAELHDRNMVVVDIGGGTGFTTLGIVKHVDAMNATILDQSPHQLAKAKENEPLKECRKIEGDAEDLRSQLITRINMSLLEGISNSFSWKASLH